MSSGYDGNYGWEVVNLPDVMNIVDMRVLVQLPKRFPACVMKQARHEKAYWKRLRLRAIWTWIKLGPEVLERVK